MIKLKLVAVFIFAFSLSAFAHHSNCDEVNNSSPDLKEDNKSFSLPLPLVEKRN